MPEEWCGEKEEEMEEEEEWRQIEGRGDGEGGKTNMTINHITGWKVKWGWADDDNNDIDGNKHKED
jgi:hypothetical protein